MRSVDFLFNKQKNIGWSKEKSHRIAFISTIVEKSFKLAFISALIIQFVLSTTCQTNRGQITLRMNDTISHKLLVKYNTTPAL